MPCAPRSRPSSSNSSNNNNGWLGLLRHLAEWIGRLGLSNHGLPFNLFVLQGMTGRQITWIGWQTLLAFVLMLAAVGLLYAFPSLVTWLPGQMIG